MKEYRWSAQILVSSNRLQKVEFLSTSNLREDAEQRCRSLFWCYRCKTVEKRMELEASFELEHFTL